MINKLKSIIKKYDEVIKYLFFGFLTTIVSLLSYYIMTLFLDVNNPFLLQICNIISWILSVLFAFYTNKKYVFKSKEKNKSNELIKFTLGRVFTLLIDMSCMFIFVSLWHFNDKIVKLLLQVVIIILNYIVSKFYVFQKNKKAKEINIKKFIIKNKFNIMVFIIFFIICILTPLSGDDYGNYVTSNSLIENIKTTIDCYKEWEGRIISRFLILELVKYKFIWNILTPILMTAMYSSLMKLINTKKISTHILMILGILLVNISMFAQTYTWVTGSITYLYPTALTICYFSYLYRTIDKKKNWFEITILCLANIIIPMFVENIGCAFVFGNILYIIYLIINKKKYKINILYTSISIASLITMLLSPGSHYRAIEYKEFEALSIFEKIFYNIENFITYGITKNYFMLFLITICLNIFIFKKIKKSNFIKTIILIIFDIIPLLSILQNVFNLSFINKYVPEFLKYSMSNKIFIIYWIIFFFLFLYNIYIITKSKKKDLIHILLIFAGMSSILSMLIVYVWGERVALLEVIILTYISIKILDDFLNDKYVLKFMVPIFSIVIIAFVLVFISCHKINKYRIDYINKQISENKNEITVIYNPIIFIWNPNLPDDYFLKTYKEYVGIDQNKEISIKKLSLKEYIDIVL